MNETANILLALSVVRGVVMAFQHLAKLTPSPEDDETLYGLASALDRVERALDWVSVGPSIRKR